MSDAAYAGGAERYLYLLMGGLDRTRFAPSVVAKAGKDLDAWCAGVARLGIPVSRVRMNLPFRPHDALGIWHRLQEHAPDIVHVNVPGPYDGQMGTLALLARLAGTRVVATTEHLPMADWLWKRATLKRLMAPFVDRVFTVCRANVPYLTIQQAIAEHKIEVVYNGLPPGFAAGASRERARRELKVGDDTVAVAFVGSLIKRKGLHVLLEALGKLEARRPWHLFVMGAGPEEERGQGDAARLGIGGSVSFLGWCDVEALLPGMDVLTVPSFMEGMPYVILEAMSCGLPVVATAVHGHPEAVVDQETGLLVPAGDAVALTGALERIVDQPGDRIEMGRRGRHRYEMLFTLDRHIDRMERAYTALVGTPHDRSR